MKSDARLLSFLLWLTTAYAGLWYGLMISTILGWVLAGILFGIGIWTERTAVHNRKRSIIFFTWIIFLGIWIPSFFLFSELFALAYGTLLGLYYFLHRETFNAIWSKD